MHRKDSFLCYKTYISRTFRIFAVLIEKTRCKTRSSKREGQQKMKIMKKNENVKIMMLQYRIKRYHAMGNGTMCQALNGQLQKLLLQQPAM